MVTLNASTPREGRGPSQPCSPWESETTVTPHGTRRERRLREGKGLAQGHTAPQWQSRGDAPGLPDSGARPSPPHCRCTERAAWHSGSICSGRSLGGRAVAEVVGEGSGEERERELSLDGQGESESARRQGAGVWGLSADQCGWAGPLLGDWGRRPQRSDVLLSPVLQ